MSAVLAPRNLALCFEEPLTSVLRIRSSGQPPADLPGFRTQMRRLLQTAMAEAKNLGYSSGSIQMALLAAIGFLDESILNLQNPAVAEWTRRPLQEEIFGGHVAGETFFANLAQLLQGEDSPEAADALEVHCLCLELGFRGRLAFGGGAAEAGRLVAQCRSKIGRARPGVGMFPPPVLPPAAAAPSRDRLGFGLLVAAVVLAVSTAVAFAGYQFSLSNGAARVADTPVTSPTAP